MKLKDSLPSIGVYRLARHVASAYGFPWVDYGIVQKRYRDRYPEPLILYDGDNMMWIDRYYIATQLDDGDIVYHYLTRHHIAEEVIGYRQAAKARGIPVALPEDIRRTFQTALKYMSPHGTNLWISPEFSSEKSDNWTKPEFSMCYNGIMK